MSEFRHYLFAISLLGANNNIQEMTLSLLVSDIP